LEYRILGPLEVACEGNVAPVRSGKERTLLAALLVRPNAIVSTDELVDALWGEEPPESSANAIQVHVSHLRRAIRAIGPRHGAAQVVVTRSPGYLIRVGPDELDAELFDRLREAGRREIRDGDLVHGSNALRSALALWRGPALSEFMYEPFAQVAIARFEALHRSIWQELIGAELALGHHASVVGELGGLVRSHPLQEDFRAQLMIALYRCGRQADALEVARDTRRVLADELGIDPSMELQRLETAILIQDGSLDLPEGSPELEIDEIDGAGGTALLERHVIRRGRVGESSLPWAMRTARSYPLSFYFGLLLFGCGLTGILAVLAGWHAGLLFVGLSMIAIGAWLIWRGRRVAAAHPPLNQPPT